MFAYKHAKRRDVIDLAILTSNNDYIEYTLEFRQKFLTPTVSRRIRSLFADYIIDKNSDIMVNDRLTEHHPLYQYFMILHQHIQFKLGALTLDRIVGRISYYYMKKTYSKRFFKRVWKLIIERGQCPWITESVNYILQNKGVSMAYRIKTIRMAMFYIVVKNHLYTYVKKSINRRKEKSSMIQSN